MTIDYSILYWHLSDVMKIFGQLCWNIRGIGWVTASLSAMFMFNMWACWYCDGYRAHSKLYNLFPAQRKWEHHNINKYNITTTDNHRVIKKSYFKIWSSFHLDNLYIYVCYSCSKNFLLSCLDNELIAWNIQNIIYLRLFIFLGNFPAFYWFPAPESIFTESIWRQHATKKWIAGMYAS